MNIVFVHGAWMTPLCWEKFNGFFTAQGFTCTAPAWPYKDRSIDDQRQSPDPRLAQLGITEIVDHYAAIIKDMNEPPLLIGHSFGGLFVQMLLDRGLGAAGVAIDSAPPKDIFAFYPTVLRANTPILTNFGFWNKIIYMSQADFAYAFVNTLPEGDQKTVYDRFVVPETGRIFFQAAASMLNNVLTVNFANDKRAPLLLIAGSADHIVPAVMNRANWQKYQGSGARTDFKEFPGRSHWIIASPGWAEVAGYIGDWVANLRPS